MAAARGKNMSATQNGLGSGGGGGGLFSSYLLLFSL